MISSTVDKIHEFMHTRARAHTHIREEHRVRDDTSGWVVWNWNHSGMSEEKKTKSEP